MKAYNLLLLAAALSAFSCSKDSPSTQTPSPLDVEGNTLYHDEIVLGDKLDNPYTLANVKSALFSLYPTKAVGDIVATDRYVRFLPKDDAQLDTLEKMDIVLIDHPVDYRIVKEGDYYHDPSVDSDDITWQYALVPYDFNFPKDIRYEILDECYLADNAPKTKAAELIDWEAVEAESFRLTGNSDMLSTASTKGDRAQPEGRITIVDPDADGGQSVGLAGVMVACNVFVKISTTYTDKDGYYKIPKSFIVNPRYRLVFKNDKGFSIGFNLILIPASVSTLGRNSPSGLDYTVTADSDRKLFRRSVVNNAAYDFLTRCEKADLGITPPPSDLRIWMFDSSNSGSAVMLHHGTVMDKESKNKIFAAVSWAVALFGPDITLGTKDCSDYKSIYSLVNHELAHATHYALQGNSYWNTYIKYIVRSFVEGKDTYGDGSGDGAGNCAIGEMWAYYLESKFFKDRYGGANPAFGSFYWFHPQIFTYLEDRGLSTAQLQKALQGSDITTVNALHSNMLALYPEKQTAINQVFNRYE